MARVTTVDIAKKLGVSQPTVSTILNGSRSNTRVSNKLRESVIRTARELGYRPNSAAVAMKRGNFNAIGILSSTVGSRGMLPSALLWSIQQAVMERGKHLALGQMPDEQLTDEEDLPGVLRNWSVDGLLLSYTAAMPKGLLELIGQYHMPVIHLNADLDHDCIRPDDYRGAADATGRLIDLGHRRITYVGIFSGHEPHYSVAARQQGYVAAMAEAGLTPVFAPFVQPYDAAAQDAFASDLLRSDDRPTAVICYATATAQAMVFNAALQGLVLGRDLSVVTFSGARQESVGPYCIDYVVVPEAAMGNEAVDLLCRKIARPRHALSPRVLRMKYNPGQTTGPAKPEIERDAGAGRSFRQERSAKSNPRMEGL